MFLVISKRNRSEFLFAYDRKTAVGAPTDKLHPTANKLSSHDNKKNPPQLRERPFCGVHH